MTKMVNKKVFREGHTYVQWIIALLANLTLFIFGLDCGWISPTIKVLRSENSPTGSPVSETLVSWMACSMSIAGFCSVSVYSYIADAYGRKISVLLIAIPQAISWIIKLTYCSSTTIIIARFCAGLSAGGCFNIVPMYVKEISQDDIRGILGTLPNLMQTSGIFVIYLLGAYLEYFTVIKVLICLPVITVLLLLRAPESPEFLVKQGKFEEAANTIALLRGLDKDDGIVENIVDSMKKEAAHFKSLPDLTITSILKEKPWRRGFILITAIFLVNGLNGVVVILNFGSSILKSTGATVDISPETQTLSFPIVIIIGSLLLASVVERYGRKILLFGSFLISAASMGVIAILIIVKDHGGHVPSWLPLLMLALTAAMFGAGVAPLPFVIITEMFSFQVRAKVMGVIVTFSWFLAFVQIGSYIYIVNAMGNYSPFIIYAMVNLMGALCTIIFLPETSGKSEEEILQLLKNGKTKTNEIAMIVQKSP